MTAKVLSTLSLSLLLTWMPHAQGMENNDWQRKKSRKNVKTDIRKKHIESYGLESYIQKYGKKCLIKDFPPKVTAHDLENAKKALAKTPDQVKPLDARDYIHELIRMHTISQTALDALNIVEQNQAQKDLSLYKQVYKGVIRTAPKAQQEQATQDLSQSVMMAENLEASQVVPVQKQGSKGLGFTTKLKDWYYGTHKNVSTELTRAMDLSAQGQQQRLNKAIDYCAKHGMITDLTKIYESLKVLNYKLVDPAVNARALKAFATAKNAQRASLANLIAQASINIRDGITNLLEQLDKSNTALLQHIREIQNLHEEQKLVHETGMIELDSYDDTFTSHEENDIYASIHMQKPIEMLSLIAEKLELLQGNECERLHIGQ